MVIFLFRTLFIVGFSLFFSNPLSFLISFFSFLSTLSILLTTWLNTQSDHFQRVDEKRQLDYEAKLAVKRARDRHAATSKKFRSLNRIGGGGFDKILDCVNAFVSL